MSYNLNDVEYLESIIKPLLLSPEEVSIERQTDEMGVLLSLKVAPADMGRVIGREGKNALAIRTLMRAFGLQSKSRVNVRIVEPEGSTFRRPKPDLGEFDGQY